MRNSFDFAPYRRSTIGFDRFFDLLETGTRPEDGYPAFDIERESEDHYTISLAVPGFRPGDIEIVAQNNLLTVAGRKPDAVDDDAHYLHRGISRDAFERRFQLADFVVVERADFEHGLLRIALRHEVPEAMKPRRIPIGAGTIGQIANDRADDPQSDREAA